MSLNHILKQLEDKDQECSSLANQLQLSTSHYDQEKKRLEKLAAKQAHFQAQVSRLEKLTNEMREAYRISDQSCIATNKSVQEKLELKSALKITLDDHIRSLAKINDNFSSSISEVRAHVDMLTSTWCLSGGLTLVEMDKLTEN